MDLSFFAALRIFLGQARFFAALRMTGPVLIGNVQ